MTSQHSWGKISTNENSDIVHDGKKLEKSQYSQCNKCKRVIKVVRPDKQYYLIDDGGLGKYCSSEPACLVSVS